ncbi:MAG: LysR family transcriptional regulator [Akkermansiaceae bacterium]|jgi:DNA-binding transcriptional LysR family regulator|nr:LysR family transcriptional regulator [Akkermansiaceae bacterium]
MNAFDRLFLDSGLSLDRLRTFLEIAEAGNIAKAAKGDSNRQSQFSRQLKELEGFFGVALSRKVGRRIEITEEGHRLAGMIRRHFSELDDFREVMSGRPTAIRIGAAASVLEWMVLPKVKRCREVLGEVVLELEPCRSADVARGVSDGRLDFGILREDAAPAEAKRWKLGRIGYALFAPKAAWRSGAGIASVFARHDFGELLPGGQFHDRYRDLLVQQKWSPRVIARAGSFLQLAKLVRTEGVAAVLPATAAVEFDAAKLRSQPLPWKHERSMMLVANSRNLERLGIRPGSASALAKLLAWEGGLL